MSKVLVLDTMNALSTFKDELATRLGTTFANYNGNLTSRQYGSVGGEMVKATVEEYQSGFK